MVSLPEVGVKGNSHMMMDKNNGQIADLIQKWLTTQYLLSRLKQTSADLRWLVRSHLMVTVIGSLRPETTGHHHAAL